MKQGEAHALEFLAHRYLDAKEVVIAGGFAFEIDAASPQMGPWKERDLLTEAAWVLFNSGMRETTVRRLFGDLTQAFLRFESAIDIVADAEGCMSRALAIFNHPGKVAAVITFAERIQDDGGAALLCGLRMQGPEYLLTWPYFGAATSCHLAKNLGLRVAKPDRHLLRIARALGFDDPQDLCEAVSGITGDDVHQVDLVFWRFATMNDDYLAALQYP